MSGVEIGILTSQIKVSNKAWTIEGKLFAMSIAAQIYDLWLNKEINHISFLKPIRELNLKMILINIILMLFIAFILSVWLYSPRRRTRRIRNSLHIGCCNSIACLCSQKKHLVFIPTLFFAISDLSTLQWFCAFCTSSSFCTSAILRVSVFEQGRTIL